MKASSGLATLPNLSDQQKAIFEAINKALKAEPWCLKSEILKVNEIQGIETELCAGNEYKEFGEVVDSAAETLHNLFPLHGTPKDGEGFLWNLWELILYAAQKVQRRSWGWLTLVLMVTKLQARTPSNKITAWGSQYDLWTDLPLLGPCMREFWIDPTLEENEKNDPEMNETWLSLNSFAAGLLRTGTVSWVNFAVWQLRTALELGCDFDKNRLLVAGEWILLAGDRVFQFVLFQDPSILPISEAHGPFWRRNWLEIARSMARGDAAGILSGSSIGRWELWKQRFFEKGAREAAFAMDDASSGSFEASPYARRQLKASGF